jgi:hypothetical protein
MGYPRAAGFGQTIADGVRPGWLFVAGKHSLSLCKKFRHLAGLDLAALGAAARNGASDLNGPRHLYPSFPPKREFKATQWLRDPSPLSSLRPEMAILMYAAYCHIMEPTSPLGSEGCAATVGR